MSRHSLLLLSLITLLFISTPASAQGTNPPDKPIHSGTVSRTNGIYDVFVEDINSNIGAYTVRTGVNHPVTSIAGAPQNVLFGGTFGSPATSFNTIRSYTTNTDYVMGPGHTSNYTVINLSTIT